jgi:heat shock protein HslJ
MNRLKPLPYLLLTVLAMSALLAACSQGTSKSEPTPAVTSQPGGDLATAAPETTAESTTTGLTAAIVSGDSAAAGKPFTFDATQSSTGDLAIVNYQWNMGDGTTLFGVSVEHAYGDPGLYTVSLTVIDEQGNVDVTAKVVEVTELTEEPQLTDDDEFTLVGTTWLMDKPLRGTTVTLTISETTLSGSSGCNTYEANYTAVVDEDSLSDVSVGTISSSSQSCTAEIMAQERGYLESLASIDSITITESKLVMETGSGTLFFTQVELN